MTKRLMIRGVAMTNVLTSANFTRTTLAGVLALGMVISSQTVFAKSMQETKNPKAPRLDAPMADSRAESRTQVDTKRTSIFGGPGYFTAAAGVGLPSGLGADNSTLNLRAAYNVQYSPEITGRVMADLNMGTGSDNAYFNDFAVGANYFIPPIQLGAFKPYVGGDAGAGFVRKTSGETGGSLALAADTGFQWLAKETALDVSLRYEVLAASIGGTTPALVGLNAGINF